MVACAGCSSSEADSTNNYATRLISTRSAEEGTVVLTFRQTQGRGHGKNVWESAENQNLTFSMVLYPTFLPASRQFLLSQAVSLGITGFLKNHTGDVKIKWPNDIYVGDSKIAGVLIENSILDGKIGSSIAGIGLNLNQTRFISGAPNPVSLKMLTGEEYDPKICLKQLIKNLDKSYKQLLAADHENIRSRFSSLLYRLNEWHSYRAGDMIFEGKIAAVTGRGNLTVVDRAGKSLEFGTKEIEYIL